MASSSFEHVLDIQTKLKTASAEAAAATLRQLALELQELTFDEFSSCKATLGMGTSSFTKFLMHEDEDVGAAAARE